MGKVLEKQEGSQGSEGGYKQGRMPLVENSTKKEGSQERNIQTPGKDKGTCWGEKKKRERRKVEGEKKTAVSNEQLWKEEK